MHHRVNAFIGFASHFFRYTAFVRDVLTGLLMLLLLGGLTISHLEDLPLGQAFYFTFITGLSIGYGDISPKTGGGCVVSVAIGMIGMVLTGMMVAIATRALADSMRERTERTS